MKMRLKALLLGLCLATSPLHAAEPWNDEHPKVYVVKSGDTLWGIADMFLQNPWKWPEIWHINKQIENPHLIYPGDRIKLVYIEGKPMLTLERNGNGNAFETELPDGTIKLSPKTRVSKLDSVIPAIPLEAVQSFLVNNRVVDEEELDEAAYVVAGGQKHILMGVGDQFYARGDFETELESAYGVFRKGEPYVDPDTKEVLGHQAIDLGLAKKLRVEGDIGTLKLLSTKQDIRIGDRLLPTVERKLDSVFYPKSPDTEIEGKIIHVFGGVRNVSQYNVVVLNRGERDLITVGDVLAVYRQGEEVRDRYTKELLKLPNERAGLLIVFRVFEKVSYGLILKADRVLKVLDEVKNP